MHRDPICDVCGKENVDNAAVIEFFFIEKGEKYQSVLEVHWHQNCFGKLMDVLQNYFFEAKKGVKVDEK